MIKCWKRLLIGTFCLALVIGASGVRAQVLAPVDLGEPSGNQASITATAGRLNVVFESAEWPNVHWKPADGQAWDFTGQAALAFTVSNPNVYPVAFSVRVDDDPSADGVHHTHSATATIEAGMSKPYYVELSAANSKTLMGMNGGPPQPGRAGMTSMSGWGDIDTSHIVAFQIFLHKPQSGTALSIGLPHLLPTLSTDALYKGIVDQFGQFTRADWPGKLRSESEFASRRADEEHAVTAEPELPGRDLYGGWADGPKLPAAGYFTTTKRNGRWWLVTPSGHLFLSFGIDAVDHAEATIVDPRSEMFTSLPAPTDPLAKYYGQAGFVLYGPYKSGKSFDFYQANLQRKYGPDFEQAWGTMTFARLKSWGFNTIGNWSDEELEAVGQMPYTATLSVGGKHDRVSSGSDYWGKTADPFDPQFAVDCDSTFKARASALKDDPMCLGWFVDNEISWSGGTVEKGRYGLAYGSLAAPAGEPAKAAFVAQLKAKYLTVAALNAAWGSTLSSWDELDSPYAASTAPTDEQKVDMSKFVYSYAHRYFTVVHDTLKKYDPNHLYLGCRFASGYNPDAVRAAADICDVVSCNVYHPTLTDSVLQDEYGFPANPSDLNKPCLIGEFHCGALDRGLFHPGLVSTPNQAARAQTFSNYIQSVVDNPAFVGAHWFQYVDEPLTGRTYDGENYNIGFVTVTDTAYPEMVAAARHVLADVYTRRENNK